MKVNRRRFMKFSLKSAVVLAGTGIASIGMAARQEAHSLEVSEHRVPVCGLGAARESLLVAHLTDLHLHTLGYLHEEIITTVRRKNPALIVLTGDIINSERALTPLEEFCRHLTGPERTIVATLGNHEYQGRVRVSRIREVYRRSGVQLLQNEALHLPYGLTVVGVGDYTTRQDDFRRAVHGLSPRSPRVLLTHAPLLLDRLPPHSPRFDLILCGHTHGGQICIGSGRQPLVVNSGRFVAGFYETRGGPVYVSRGIGTTLLPLRLNCPPELPFFQLVRA